MSGILIILGKISEGSKQTLFLKKHENRNISTPLSEINIQPPLLVESYSVLLVWGCLCSVVRPAKYIPSIIKKYGLVVFSYIC